MTSPINLKKECKKELRSMREEGPLLTPQELITKYHSEE
jgi:hypothetical protein